MADDDAGKATEKTFTQADVDRLIRERLAREREKYADYEDLKAKAAAADKGTSQLDKIQEQLTAMQARAEKAEAATLRRDVADELGLTARQAGRLRGGTREELLADGREYMEDNGIKPRSERTDDAKPEADADETPQPAPRRMARPREDLRSGAPISDATPEETDPRKLAAMVPRR